MNSTTIPTNLSGTEYADGCYQSPAPAVGRKLMHPNGAIKTLLESNWDAADFRLSVGDGGPIRSLACNVEVTGKTLVRKDGREWVRCTVIYVGDGEPDTKVSGFMMEAEKVWASK